jgi:hypothetical protein
MLGNSKIYILKYNQIVSDFDIRISELFLSLWLY